MCSAVSPASASTPAGTVVNNVARATLTSDGLPAAIASDTVSVRIGELLDVALATTVASAATLADAVVATPFVLNNLGNGNEAFLLHGAVTAAGIALIGFAVDTNGNGRYDAGIDAAIANDAATPPLSPGASATLFVLLRGEGAGAGDALTITARATTGAGRPGTAYAGAGDDGSDAIVGLTGASATINLPLVPAPSSGVPEATVIKSQSVVAPDGSDQPVSGAVITYTLAASFAGSGIARAARFTDPLPRGTLYVPDSLRLDGQPLTDAADGDLGTFDGAAVRIALGDVVAPAARNFSFQVTIQ